MLKITGRREMQMEEYCILNVVQRKLITIQSGPKSSQISSYCLFTPIAAHTYIVVKYRQQHNCSLSLPLLEHVNATITSQ